MPQVRLLLTDAAWQELAVILEKVKHKAGSPPRQSDRMFIEAVLYIARTDFLPFVKLNWLHFLPHLHDRLTTNSAGVIARTITQHGHQNTQESVANIA